MGHPDPNAEVVTKHLIPELDVHHTLTSPLFVVGHARSGTTIVGNMVRKYLKVNFGPESQFFFRLREDLPRYGDLQKDENFSALVTDIAAERCFSFNQFGYVVDVEDAVKNAPRDYAQTIAYIYEQYAQHNWMTRWGDKTPSYVDRLDDLDALFPDAQYLYVVRDGRDVALSNFDVFFGAKNAVKAAVEWRHAVRTADRFFNKIPERVIEVRYEDFLEDPVREMIRLKTFLRIDDADGKVEARFRADISSDLVAANYNKWKTMFSAKQKRNFERVAQSELINKGYEICHGSLPPMGKLSIFSWHLLHMLKKYTYLRAWTDNWYQLQLRLGSLRKRLAR